MADQFEILNNYPQKEKVGGIGEVFSDKLLLRYKGSEIKAPVVLPPGIIGDIERVKNFEVYENDVFIAGFPRSGTTFAQEMVWIIVNDFDFEGAKNADAYNRAYWFDLYTYTCVLQGPGIGPNHLDTIPRPRCLKTHYPVQLLPPKIWSNNGKVVYISRDVKDVAVSGYWFRKTILHERVGTMEEHFDDFMNDKVFYGPYREYIKGFADLKDKPNVLSLTYEGCVTDWEGSIRKTAKFLGKEASNENVKKLIEYLDFKTMKKNPKTNMTHYMEMFNQLAGHNEPTDIFIRKGVIGGHKDDMSEEYIQKFNDWMAQGPPEY